MAQIRQFPFFAQLRCDASNHIVRWRRGKIIQSGRGLVFWFRRETASIAEVPMDDRETTIFVNGRSKDFQAVSVQGSLTWHVVEPERLASRVDFSLDLLSGRPTGEPIERIESRLSGLVNQSVLQYLAELPVRALVDAGLERLRARLEEALSAATSLTEIGIAVVAVRVTRLAPSSELERALQTPTFEQVQQKADEAMFERRALAVEKERAIAENELATKIELARREKLLIAEETENAQNRATGSAEAQRIAAEAEASRIQVIERAKADGEQAHIAIYRDLPPAVLMGLAARDLAGKLTRIDRINVTPDLLASLLGEIKGELSPAPVTRTRGP